MKSSRPPPKTAGRKRDGDLDRAVELYTHALGILPDEHSIDARLEELVRRQDEQELRRS
ncbi:MAG: hypothetical protein U0521_04755 [Anaerolineae bacterium]